MRLQDRVAVIARRSLVAGGLVWIAGGAPAWAVVSAGAPAAISAHAALDDPSFDSDNEDRPSTAGDGAGNWVAVWTGTAGPPLSDPATSEVWVTRSSDDGATWTPTVALAVTAGGPDSDASLATDRQGVWIVSWRSSGDSAVLVSRSVDNGASWSVPGAPFGASGLTSRVATDGAGTWVIVAENPPIALLAIRSVDDGQTWSAPVSLDNVNPLVPALATDGTGNWVTIWQRGNAGGTVAVARSTDNAATWQTPVAIGNLELGNTVLPGAVAIATDRQARWVAIWDSNPALTSQELRYAVSSDNGATWTPEAVFPPVAARPVTYDLTVSTQTAPDGTIYANWESFTPQQVLDRDIVMSRSIDGGSTWTSPATLNLRGRTDGDALDIVGHLGHDGDAGWIATWMSRNSLGGTIGEDTDILFARARDDCPATPAAGCKTSTQSGGSRLSIKDDPDGPKDKLIWTWRRGQETLEAELGSPTTTSSYVLCVYDNAGSGHRPVFEADARAALTCNGAACWTASPDEYVYRDQKRENGAIVNLRMEPGEAGRAMVKVKAMGDALGPPRLPLSKNPSVKTQLINLETDACWEATFSAAAANTSTQFKAESD